MSTRRGRPRTATTASEGRGNSPAPANLCFRIVIHSISDDGERVIADHIVDAYVAAVGRRLPTRQFEHNTLLGGPLDLAIDLAAIIPDAMTHFINKHLPRR